MSSIEKDSASNENISSFVSIIQEEIIISQKEDVNIFEHMNQERNSEKTDETDEEIRNKFTETHLSDHVSVQIFSDATQRVERTESDCKFKLLSRAQKEYETNSLNNTTNFLKGCKWF
jgi:hypothetical protein